MSLARWELLFHRPPRESHTFFSGDRRRPKLLRLISFHNPAISVGNIRQPRVPSILPVLRAGISEIPSAVSDADVVFLETFPLKRTRTVSFSRQVEGKVSVKVGRVDEEGSRLQVIVCCNLEGKWILHWGVTYCDDVSSEWDQPPPEMRPPGSIAIKGYAVETPMKRSLFAAEGKVLHEFHVEFESCKTIAAINFVLKEEEKGAWFQHKGSDFKVQLVNQLQQGAHIEPKKKSFNIWPGPFDQMSNFLLKPDVSHSKDEGSNPDILDPLRNRIRISDFYEEYALITEEFVLNTVTVTVISSEEDKNLVYFDTDMPGDVIIHWGVCRNDIKNWEIPPAPFPPSSKIFRQKALQTLLKPKADGSGSCGFFSLDKEITGVLFVLNLNKYTWLNNQGTDFYIPLASVKSFYHQRRKDLTAVEEQVLSIEQEFRDGNQQIVETHQDCYQASYTDDIILAIRNLVTDITSERCKTEKCKEAQESILREIEKLAAQAYSIFRRSTPAFIEESVPEAELSKPSKKSCSGTGSGYEILCQGFNWESHKSGRWYGELMPKADELASLGFTTVWLPPPTESVSPEGYMPKDLYNLNSRYGSMEELKDLVKRFHEVGIKVLGDVVLNHRCAHYQNANGIWNIFGGRLTWDDRAIVADDPHFQGRGNKSSGDNFHAAPNIDHSQEFVRKDLKDWLCWLRKEVGFDGWRLDFVRGFWGGYVKDYLLASEPYFAVGEYWDSLSYEYGEMEYNQDAHRQRIIDWINDTNGTAGAFDVTTKGILHTALEKCEYWRLSDEKGKPPGVLGWWPSRAVTFIENHDTGSTQGHWRFPSGKEMQGYAYILTHPGTPAVFYDHIFSHYQQEISKLISLRRRCKIHCRSMVKITRAKRDVYAAEIDDIVAVQIGPGNYEPSSGTKKWILFAEGKDYRVWEAS
ncbi:alpha-amylase 3, chloroplastic isoform X2 [Dendrobium catenatum]|uniref:alpha-amylase 3, chloroplastic isoform X2 n=1 Tax=Dendrobium catenatum TaxID=906689 RepID=UPI0010A01B15|nr:alpha-amylase 3, chloroplastic isoform X2 [Dendrobium catenatum]